MFQIYLQFCFKNTEKNIHGGKTFVQVYKENHGTSQRTVGTEEVA